MIKVDIIRPGSINAIIGPVGTLKRVLKNQEYFNSRGYEITVFTNESISIGPIKEPPAAIRPTSSAEMTFRRRIASWFRMNAKNSRWIAKYFMNKDLKKTEALVDYYISLNRTPDVLQFHSNLECQLYMQKCKELKGKTIMFLHTDGIPFKMTLQYYPCLEGSKYLQHLKENFDWTVKHVDHIVFIARIGQTNFLKYFPNRTMKDTSVVINGIDDLTIVQKNEVSKIRNEISHFKFRLCCTGTINTRKGHRIIIEALHQMDKAILKEVHVDFIGEGGERPVLEELVKKYGLSEHVTFHGLIPNVEVYRYLAKNDIYILMSRNEGLPISIIEAMRAGLPVISTNVSGIPELVRQEYNGFLLEPDVEQLTNLLNKLPDYDWIQMGRNSRSRFENEFTFDCMKSEFCNMWDTVLNR